MPSYLVLAALIVLLGGVISLIPAYANDPASMQPMGDEEEPKDDKPQENDDPESGDGGQENEPNIEGPVFCQNAASNCVPEDGGDEGDSSSDNNNDNDNNNNDDNDNQKSDTNNDNDEESDDEDEGAGIVKNEKDKTTVVMADGSVVTAYNNGTVTNTDLFGNGIMTRIVNGSQLMTWDIFHNGTQKFKGSVCILSPSECLR